VHVPDLIIVLKYGRVVDASSADFYQATSVLCCSQGKQSRGKSQHQQIYKKGGHPTLTPGSKPPLSIEVTTFRPKMFLEEK